MDILCEAYAKLCIGFFFRLHESELLSLQFFPTELKHLKFKLI